MPVISLTEVSKSFKGQPLFEGVTASFEEGRIHGLIGHNGSGKSVLFKMMCGFLSADSGSITIDAKYKGEGERFPRDFGVIIDRPGYIANRTGMDNLRELAAIRGRVGDREILRTAETLDLAQHLHRRVSTYSLGMKQKLALTQALMEDQRVLVLDEPFNALDDHTVTTVRDLLRQARDDGKTVIFTSHNREDMEVLCDTAFKINRQRLELASLS